MSSVVISGDTSGAITLSAPAVSGTNTATLPAATGTVMVSGNQPAFSAYKTTDQSISSSTQTLITFGSEDFDTNNNFASSRFTPTVAGYYQINAELQLAATAATLSRGYANIYKNGSQIKNGSGISSGGAITEFFSTVSCLIYMNGSTDYLEVYAYITGTSPTVYSSGSGAPSWFNGCLVRTA
jgi:hypothetical protein